MGRCPARPTTTGGSPHGKATAGEQPSSSPSRPTAFRCRLPTSHGAHDRGLRPANLRRRTRATARFLKLGPSLTTGSRGAGSLRCRPAGVPLSAGPPGPPRPSTAPPSGQPRIASSTLTTSWLSSLTSWTPRRSSPRYPKPSI
ncbi:unnamed protein product [Nezara viridula]|uniref:Uncharacterized protein n=1 Tax=Nezara viridula TaxID=85310 RepID=A0A9P0HK98_NEZVI|nr:unnamed protein product [Nezara viridula]